MKRKLFLSQVVFLEHISTVYPHLLRELAVLDMAKLVTLMFDSLPQHPAAAEKVVRAKLVCLKQTVNSQIFQDGESRSLLLPTVCDHLKRHLVSLKTKRLSFHERMKPSWCDLM